MADGSGMIIFAEIISSKQDFSMELKAQENGSMFG